MTWEGFKFASGVTAKGIKKLRNHDMPSTPFAIIRKLEIEHGLERGTIKSMVLDNTPKDMPEIVLTFLKYCAMYGFTCKEIGDTCGVSASKISVINARNNIVRTQTIERVKPPRIKGASARAGKHLPSKPKQY